MTDRGPLEGRPEPAVVVGRAVQGLTVRRLAHAFAWLAILAVMGIGELLVLGRPDPWAIAVAAGAPVTVLALLFLGQRGVRRAFGRAETPAWRIAGWAWLVPWAYGGYLLVGPGLMHLARLSGASGALVLAAAYALLGLRVLVDAGRVAEVGRLAATMSDLSRSAEEERA